MYARHFPTIIVAIISVHVLQALDSDHFNVSVIGDDVNLNCPPWNYVDPSNGLCKCASWNDIIKCTDEGTLLRVGYCTTYTEGEGVSMSSCPYLKMKSHAYTSAPTDSRYIVLPSNISKLNEYMCMPMNRKGLVCRECIDGFSPSFTSSDYMACSNCTASKYYGIPLFILIEFVPVTLFYLLFLLLQINVTSSPMLCYILYSQLVMFIATPSGKGLFLIHNTYFFQSNFDVATYTLYGLWNLDFFRYSLPPFCVSHGVNHSQITALDYLSIFYPLCLILLTITFIKLHDHNFKPIVCLWRPFHKFFTRIRRGWNTRSNIINVFAAFLLLSYSKLFYLIINITQGVRVHSMYNESGIVTNRTLPFIDWSTISRNDFKGKNLSLLIAIAALVLLITLLPVLLLVCYPMRQFRQVLSKLRLDFILINIFVERFYSCYKDGLDGSRDMRSFAGFYFLLRYALWFIIRLTSHLSSILSIVSLIFVGAAVLISLTRPYKRMYMTVLDAILLCLLAAIFHLLSTDYNPVQGMLTSIIIIIPAIVFWIYFMFVVCEKLRKCCQSYRCLTQEATKYGTYLVETDNLF